MTEIALVDGDSEEILSPTQRIRRVRAGMNPEPYMGLAAVAAISTGVCLAFWGLRRSRRTNADSAMDRWSSLDVAVEQAAPPRLPEPMP